MKKIFISLNLFVLLAVTGLSYGMSELEKEYKSQMELYNIELNCIYYIKRAEMDIEHVQELISLCMKHNRERVNEGYKYLENCDNKYEKDLEKAEKDYKEHRKHRDDISEKKDSLKLRVIERFGKLPKWWK